MKPEKSKHISSRDESDKYHHWEIRVLLVVSEDIANPLIQHREERAQSTHLSEVHHVVQVSSKDQ